MKNDNQAKSSQELMFSLIILSGIGWLIFTYRVLFAPLIVAGMIAYLLYPSVTWLAKKTGFHRRQLVPLVYLLFLGLLGWGIFYLFPIITDEANSLANQFISLKRETEILIIDLEQLLGVRLPLETFVEELELNIGRMLKPDQVFRIVRAASTNLVWVIIVLATSYHLLRDWEKLREWVFGLFPEHLEPDARHLHQEIKVVWRCYLRGQLLIMTFLGILSGLGAAAVGLPGAILLGFLAGSLALIPTLGPAIATAIAAFVAWTQGSSYLDLSNLAVTLIVVGIFQVVQVIEGFWLTPRIIGRRLNLHPGLVLVAIVGTLFTLGAVMALIVSPLLGSLDLVFACTRRKRAGLDPWPEEQEQLPGSQATQETY